MYNNKHDCVFRQGDYSDYFYVILFGSVVVRLRQKEGSGIENVATLVSGDYFGELAMHEKQSQGNRRTATVLTLEPTQLLRIPSREYNRIVKIAHDKTLGERVHLLNSVPVFRSISADQKRNISFLFRSRKFFPGECIFEQGMRIDETSYMILIKRGQAKLTKQMHTDGTEWFPNHKHYPVPNEEELLSRGGRGRCIS